MPTLYENYITGDDNASNCHIAGAWRGQTFTPQTAHTIDNIKLLCYRTGSPGTVTVQIKATDVDGKPTGSALATGTINGNTLPTTATWTIISLGAGVSLTASTQYAMLWTSSTPQDSVHLFQVRFDGTSPAYTGGAYIWSNDDQVSWTVETVNDHLFEEWSGTPPLNPTVTTQAVTAISGTTATGNGNVTYLGAPTATQHGHCWKVYVSEASPPTTADSKTTNGVPAATGTFTSPMTGFVAGTKYGVRAYVTNSQGTTYGAQVSFTADKGDVYPTDTLTRVSGISRTFWAGLGGGAVYEMQINTGGISTTYIPPVGTREVQAAVPQQPAPNLLAGLGYQEADYLQWVSNTIKSFGMAAIVQKFGHIPSYLEWAKWMLSGAK